MKVLIIEDDELKFQHISKHCNELIPHAEIDWKKSYQSGLNALLNCSYDLVLLDMSMHIYEKSAEEGGGSFETYAGRMILSEIDINEIETKVIVITGYDIYNDGKTLATLKQELREEFGDFYLDTIYFIGSDETWKTRMQELVKENF
jgi:DNA-binding LytR/AlgR family response regulator